MEKKIKKEDIYRIIIDTAHDEISSKLQKEKGIGKEEADEQAGRILSAAKGKEKKPEERKQEINPSKFQKKLSNGLWVDTTVDNIKWVLKRNEINQEQLIEKLKQGKSIYYDSEWYAEIRLKPTKEQEKSREKAILKGQEESLKYQKKEAKRQYERVGKYEKW